MTKVGAIVAIVACLLASQTKGSHGALIIFAPAAPVIGAGVASTGGTTAVITGGEAIAVAGGPGAAGVAVAVTPVGAAILLGALLVVGAEPINGSTSSLTWDCWKPILQETSLAPSQGRRLADILSDRRVELVHKNDTAVLVKNIWDELFEITPVVLPSGQVAAHAAKI